ncbi:MAG TPA: hypothetical protein VFD77_08965, partial [Brumimicrobium sp.]|nr:hypothetical protein [Brumimicrobium sp.]
MKTLNKGLLSICLFLTSFFLFQNDAQASHVAGGYIQLECTGTPGVYRVKLILYRDCSGTTINNAYTVNFTNSCGLNNVNVNVTRQSMQEVSQ